MNQSPPDPTPQDSINIEEIMQQIRREILLNQAVLRKDGSPLVNLNGKQLPAEFYEHLYNAALAHDAVGVKLHVTKVNIPLIGPVLEKLRTIVHQLVLYYVNQLATQQVSFNYHILQAVNTLALKLEEEREQASTPAGADERQTMA